MQSACLSMGSVPSLCFSSLCLTILSVFPCNFREIYPPFLSVSVFRCIYSPYKQPLPVYKCTLGDKSCLFFLSTCREPSCCLSFSPLNLHKLHPQIFSYTVFLSLPLSNGLPYSHCLIFPSHDTKPHYRYFT